MARTKRRQRSKPRRDWLCSNHGGCTGNRTYADSKWRAAADAKMRERE